MSRIGKAPIKIPAKVEVAVSEENIVTVKGPRGELKQNVNPQIKIEIEDGVITLAREADTKDQRGLHGLYRALINNMIEGVSNGYTIKQELVGVGYRAKANGQLLELTLGYSHPIVFELPKEIALKAEQEKGKNPTITLESSDKQLLGLVAAKIRSFRKPEPYKGKGIRFSGEVIRRKAGKSASKK
jgi:large subunit ribosomal protein L6